MSNTPPARSSWAGDNPVLLSLLEDQANRWRRGERVLVEDYQAAQPWLAEQPEALLELLANEIHLRRQAGEKPLLNDYLRRFAGLTELLLRLFEAGGPSEGETLLSMAVPPLPDLSATIPRLEPDETPPPDLPGYEILEELGRGGMGVVYKARHRQLNRVVALKMILPGKLARPEERLRFLAEAEAIAALGHPGIVRIHDFGTHQGVPYFSLEFCSGGSLAGRLAELPLPPRDAAGLIEQVARAVQAAHDRGIVHRDLKPGNILLSEDGTPRVGDFGLAKRVEGDGLTATGAVVGTPGYMAPEQARGGKDVGKPADVYALGAILYDCLTGRAPFKAANVYDTLLQVVGEEPVQPRQLNPKVPRDLETICLKCLRKDPSRRYHSAAELSDDLARFLAGQPIRARRIGALGRLMLWCRRQPALAATIAGAVLSIALMATVAFIGVLRERDRYRNERDRAESNLYRALLSDTRAQMQARDTGWWWKAMTNLEEAAGLDVAERDSVELRELAVECLGADAPCFRLRATLEGHTGPVFSVARSPDGRLAASGGRDRTVRLWSLPDGAPLDVLAGHGGTVTGLAFSPDGKQLASGSADGTLRLWDAQKPGPAVRVLDLKAGAVRAVEFSPDGAFLVAACQDGTIRVLDRKVGKSEPRTLRGHNSPVTCLTFSSAGLLASGSDKTIRFWNVAAGKQTQTWPGSPSTLAFYGADRNLVLAGGNIDGRGFGVRSLANDDQRGLSHLHSGGVIGVRLAVPRDTFSSYPWKGFWLTASLDGTLKLWRIDGATPQLVAVARGGFPAVRAVALRPGDEEVIAGYEDGRVRLWQLFEPTQRAWIDRSHNAAFLGESRRLVGHRLMSDWPAGKRIRVASFTPAGVCALAVHPAGKTLTLARLDGHLEVWTLPGRQQQRRWRGHDRAVAALALHRDGRRLASASADGTVKLWDHDSGRLERTLNPGIGALHAVAWGRQSDHLAVSGERGVVLYEPGLRLLSERTLTASGVALSGDAIAFSSADGAIEVRELLTGRLRHKLVGHAEQVSAIAFSADGKLLASHSTDGALRWWDPGSGAELAVFRLRAIKTRVLAFDPLGRYLASSSALYDLRTKTETASVHSAGDGCGCFTPDGAALLLGTDEGGVQAVHLADVARARAAGPRLTGVVRVDPGSEVVPGTHGSSTWGVAASPDGKWFATATHYGAVYLWDGQNMKLARALPGHAGLTWSVAFSPDSRYLASGSGEIKVWDVATGKLVHVLEGHKRLIVGLAFHPHRPWLASAALDGSMLLWDMKAGRLLGAIHHFDSSVHGLAFRPDGAWLAAACHDRRVALWRCADEPPLDRPPDRTLNGHDAPVWAVAFSADGKLLASGSEQGMVLLSDGETFERRVALRGGAMQVRSLSFSRDGELLAVAAFVFDTLVWDLSAVRRRLQEMGLDFDESKKQKGKRRRR